jgi:glycosyltransferase involved in cell wall biosynthesis
MRVSVVIPAKNEANSLRELLPRLWDIESVAEIVVVDDGSNDGTGSVARENGARLVQHSTSLGNGGAIKAGARAAENDYIVFMDGDGQHQADDIPAMIEHLEIQGADMVVGARDESGQASFARRLANGFYNRFASVVTGQSIRDLTSGFRIVRRELFLKYLYLLPNGFSYPTTITMAFLRGGHQVSFLPVTVLRREGQSNIKPLRDGIRFLLIIFKVGTLYSPLKVFFPIAVVHFILGLVRYAYTYIEMGSFTNMSALLFVTSVHIFLVGLVSEQITTLMYKET